MVQSSIKELYNPKHIINNFNDIEFENVNVFLHCIQYDYYNYINKNASIIKININSLEELNTLSNLLEKTNLYNMVTLNLKFSKDCFYKVLEDSNNKIYNYIYPINIDFIPELTTKELLEKYPHFKNWFSKKPIIIDYEIEYNNFIDRFNNVITILRNKQWRFFNFKFDFISFEEMKIKEYALLEFWINHIISWTSDSRNRNGLVFNYSNKFIKTVYIDNKLNLKYNNNGETFFNIYNSINKNGEDFSNEELSKLHQYLELNESKCYFILKSKLFNWCILDFDQNLKLETSINEIPIITQLVGGLLINV